MPFQLVLNIDGRKSTHRIRHRETILGRSKSADVTVASSEVSAKHAKIIVSGETFHLEDLNSSNGVFVDGKRVSGRTPVGQGSTISLGRNGPTVLIMASQSRRRTTESTAISESRSRSSTSNTKKLAPAKRSNYQIAEGGVIGRDEGARFQFRHPNVSRRHAMIVRDGNGYIIFDLKSGNGTFIDGHRLGSKHRLEPGQRIGIGPFTLVFDGLSLISESRQDNVELSATGLSYIVDDANSRKQIYLLRDVSFKFMPGEFVAVLGPSGSGKSTLLRIISGRRWPFAGYVKLNSMDLHDNFAALKEDMVVVPQSTKFHGVLSIRQVVNYSAALRLPFDFNGQERGKIVATSIERVGLSNRADTQVAKLSGGQKKRLAFAVELVSNPSLLFLDEVTSGLDEKADGEMMQLMRQLANSGKTLICITHNLAHVEKYCHKVLVLTVGGRVAFFGKASEARSYFGIRSISEVYEALESKTPDQWSTKFRQMQNSRTGEPDSVDAKPRGNTPYTFEKMGLRPVWQMFLLAQRYIQIWLKDWAALLALFGQAVLVTCLLCLVFHSIPSSDIPEKIIARKTQLRNLLFLIGVSCFWLGANNAAKELVKERTIYQRERNFNLSPEAYGISKLGVLSLIGVFQSVMLTLIACAFCDVPGNFVGYLGTSIVLSLVGTSLGLAISAVAKTEELAVALVPVVVIPQIILAGVVSELTGISEYVGMLFTSSYWGQSTFESFLPDNDQLNRDSAPSNAFSFTILSCQAAFFLLIGWLGVRFFNRSTE